MIENAMRWVAEWRKNREGKPEEHQLQKGRERMIGNGRNKQA
jgi:hypothetical protein